MKRKLFLFSTLFLLLFALTACDFLNTTTSQITTFLTSDRTETTTTTTTSTSTTTSTTSSGDITTSTTTSEGTDEPFIPSGYSLLQDELDVVGIPSLGDVKILVFAVDFSDYPASTSGVTLSDINTVFNGDTSAIDYESLRSYYQISSYGNLDIQADVYGFYRASHNAAYYENEYEKLWAVDPITGDWLYSDDEVTYPDSDLIFEILEYYDGTIDYSDYDANGDGYIDGVYIVYTHPVSYSSGSDLWWAYQDMYAYEGDLFDGVEPWYFVWSGTDFMLEGDDNLNARTVIHETGHMLGLDDYYDYYDGDAYNSGGLGGADMMDYTVGDHNPFSKLLLGWITPWVVETSMTVDLQPFVDSGEFLLIIDQWNNSIFDEYFLVSFYTPTSLNQADQNYLFTTPGVLIYHISAQIGNGYDENSYYYSIFNYNNTDTSHKLIKIIEADMNGRIDSESWAENGDLFQVGDIFGSNVYPTYRWYNNTALGFDIDIVSVGDNATIHVIFG